MVASPSPNSAASAVSAAEPAGEQPTTPRGADFHDLRAPPAARSPPPGNRATQQRHSTDLAPSRRQLHERFLQPSMRPDHRLQRAGGTTPARPAIDHQVIGQPCSTSASWWLDTSTVRPRRRQGPVAGHAVHRMPAGSQGRCRARRGSAPCGFPERPEPARRHPESLPAIPSGVTSRHTPPRPAGPRESDGGQHLIRPASAGSPRPPLPHHPQGGPARSRPSCAPLASRRAPTMRTGPFQFPCNDSGQSVLPQPLGGPLVPSSIRSVVVLPAPFRSEDARGPGPAQR